MLRWNIQTPKKSIEWILTPGELHSEDIEMAGFYVSDTVKYGVDAENGFFLVHHPVYPTLRKKNNNTHGSYQLDIESQYMPAIIVDGKGIKEELRRVVIDGTLILETEADGLSIVHHCFPSTDMRATYELVKVTNNTGKALTLNFTTPGVVSVHEELGCKGICITEVFHDGGETILKNGETYTLGIAITGRLANEEPEFDKPEVELDRRYRNIARLTEPMKIDTGNDLLDTMFTFAKIRAGESVFDTMTGLMHSPGGYSYYAATWCNDQVEYAGPYFAYTGDNALIEASYNAYKMYTPFMSQKYDPIPSSVIAEGLSFWNGAGDRGDAAMYLYGASRFSLTCGDVNMARALLPGIRWCAEYCRRKTNEFGVVQSDFDELEGRFPAGEANLCTNTLCYSGLLTAAALEEEIGDSSLAECYRRRAEELREAIDSYFACNIHDMNTYAYYENCQVLRSWICMPLCVGICDRAEGTVAALCSEYLMTPEGLLTAEGCPTIWDRSTLYGLRGIFASGYTEKAAELLLNYCALRLLGERVPYAVEAYPEGGKRHLSGESALFCKVITEGLLCMNPTGLRSFTLNPSLPAVLNHLYLTNIKAHGAVFDVLLEKDSFRVVRSNGRIMAEGTYGKTVEIIV